MWVMTAAGIGTASFVIAVWAIWRKRWPRISIVLMLIAGLTVAGLLGGFGDRAGSFLARLSAALTSKTFGVALAGVICGLLLLELGWALWPKKGKPHRWLHSASAFIVPSVCFAVGGPFAKLAGWGTDAVEQLATVSTSLFGMVT